MSKSKNLTLKVVALAAMLAVVAGMVRSQPVQEALENSLVWIESLGPTGPIAFILIYILCCILFIPGSLLTLGAGAVFGVVCGSIYVSIASTSGAIICFILGRYSFRRLIENKIKENRNFAAVDKAVAKEGWKIVFLTRLSPAFPFNLLNYFFGLTKVNLKHYALASWIGMMPGTVMYVYLGSLAGDLATLGNANSDQRSPAQWALYIVGLAATIGVTVYVTKIGKKALERSVQEEE